MRLALALLLVCACSDPGNAVADLAGAPPPLERVVAPPGRTLDALCCVDSMCVQPRMLQDSCDPGTYARICPTTRLSEIGPLWACR